MWSAWAVAGAVAGCGLAVILTGGVWFLGVQLWRYRRELQAALAEPDQDLYRIEGELRGEIDELRQGLGRLAGAVATNWGLPLVDDLERALRGLHPSRRPADGGQADDFTDPRKGTSRISRPQNGTDPSAQ